MSVSYYSQVIFGMPLEHRHVTRHVTRFHETTGQPYQKQIQEWVHAIPESKPMIHVDTDYDATIHAGIDDFDDLTDRLVIDSDTGTYIGIKLTEAISYDDKPVELPSTIDIEALREQLHRDVTRRFSSEVAEEIVRRAKLLLVSYAS
jgi:hypothetical protein